MRRKGRATMATKKTQRVTLTSEDLHALELNMARRYYVDYVSYVHEGRWKRSKFGEYICNEIQKFLEDDSSPSYSVLLISTPPQHGKSMTITETLPSWYLGKNPTHRVIEVSYGEEFAKKFGRRNREKISRYGEELFGIGLAVKPNSVVEFELSNNVGGMISRGVSSGITGQPANLIIIDDPIKNRKDADSPTLRGRMADEWQSSIRTRLAAGAKVIVIMTRWHDEDFGGWLIENEPNVRVINLPCECEDAENDPLGRKLGDSLCPELGKGNRWLKEFKKGFLNKNGARAWESLFQGRPSKVEGNLINREWWQYYRELPEKMLKIISVDCSFKATKDSDFVSIQVWGKSGANYYLLDRIKARLDLLNTINRILYFKTKHIDVSAVLVEDKANGPAVIQMLKNEIPGVLPVTPAGGKESRLNAVAPAIESGNVFLPKNIPNENGYMTSPTWVHEFIEEFAAFPHGATDDEVDACTQALNRLIYTYAYYDSEPVNDMDYFIQRKIPLLGGAVNIKSMIGRR